MTDRLRPQPIRSVVPGDPVAAAVVNTPLRQLLAEDGRIYDLIWSTLFPEAVLRRDAALTLACVVGTPVYLNADNAFAPAYATTDVADGVVVPAASCRVLGIVLRKSATTIGDVLLL